MYGYLMGGALALPLGATVIGGLPQSQVTTNVMGGMTELSSMYPTIARLGGVGMTVGITSKIDKALGKMK